MRRPPKHPGCDAPGGKGSPWKASILTGALLAASLAGCGGPPAGRTEGRDLDTCRPQGPRPNIVFILADDLGWADVGYHGAEIETPHIDRLAQEGVRLERHYVAPTCTPTRVALLTGRYPSRFGVLAPAYGRVLAPGTVTLASALRDAGYATSIAGKWHAGSPPDSIPLRLGFTSSYGYFHGQIDPTTHRYKTGERCWHRDDRLLDEEGHATDLITAEAVRAIASSGEAPFFLYVAYSVPHYPLAEPEEWTSRYEAVFPEPSRRWYAASVSHMDSGIGRILEALERAGKRGETLVVFASDNGAQRSWHSRSEYGGRYAEKPHAVLGDNRPWRGWKGELHEGGIRVPAVASWPGVLAPRAEAAPVHVTDWLPTLARLAGATIPEGTELDGRDIWPLLTDRGERPAVRTFYWKTPRAAAVLEGDWKLIVHRDEEREELFDLSTEPVEAADLAAREPARSRGLRALLEEIAARDR